MLFEGRSIISTYLTIRETKLVTIAKFCRTKIKCNRNSMQLKFTKFRSPIFYNSNIFQRSAVPYDFVSFQLFTNKFNFFSKSQIAFLYETSFLSLRHLLRSKLQFLSSVRGKSLLMKIEKYRKIYGSFSFFFWAIK